MNKVILCGNLGKDPELTTTTSGKKVCKFSLAVQNQKKGDDGRYGADFFNIIVWEKLAENCKSYLTKGKKALVVGVLSVRSYETDGVKKWVTEIVAHEVEFLSPKGETSQGDPSGDPTGDAMTPVNDDDLPF
jgi:single-strand DNA-binding protein